MDDLTIPDLPKPDAPSGRQCRFCRGALWVWEPGPRYPITVCDGCFEVTLPYGFQLFDSGKNYFRRAEELVAHLKLRAPGLRDMTGLGDCASPLPAPRVALPASSAPAETK
jgi:hypothetical protein